MRSMRIGLWAVSFQLVVLTKNSNGFFVKPRQAVMIARKTSPCSAEDHCSTLFAKDSTPQGMKRQGEDEVRTSSFADTDGASKGLVSTLTNIVNSFASNKNDQRRQEVLSNSRSKNPAPPSSPIDLLVRIQKDYTERNYLWTGDIDMAAFDENCRFTDPTLSFQGTEQFVRNIQNLRPIVDALVGCSRSDLLDIQLNEEMGYVQTRWNMVGELDGLFWKPKIDVIGRTRFWYNAHDFRVINYDEEWEIPAYRALLQLVTPAGTIPSSSKQNDPRGEDDSAV